MKQKMLILGFGRLGQCFFRLFHDRYNIRGVRRTKGRVDPANVVIAPIQNPKVAELLDRSEIVLFCPSSGGGDLNQYRETYLGNMEWLTGQIKSHGTSLTAFVLIGSTGVYPRNAEGPWDEGREIPIETPRQKVLLGTERRLIESGIPYLILRCGGLYGAGRGNFSRLMEQKEFRTSELRDQAFSVVHEEDVCRVVDRVLESGALGNIFNVVDESGLTRGALHRWIAKEKGIPIVEDGPAKALPIRNVPNTKLKEALGYSFIYPDVTQFLKEIWDEGRQ